MDRPIRRPWWQRRATRAAVVGALVCASIGLAISSIRAERTLRLPAERLTIAKVESGMFRDFVPLRGQVVAKDVIYVNTREGGSVERVLVQAGDLVTEGQPLVEFGNTDLQFEVMRNELSLIEQIDGLRNSELALDETRAASEQRLEDIDYNLVRLQRQAERQSFYFDKGVTTAEEREKVLDELAHYRKLRGAAADSNARHARLRERRLPEIQRSIDKLQQDLLFTRGKLDDLLVRAPASGRLTEIDLKVGQNCVRGERLAKVTLDTGFKLSADIDEYYLARVRDGQRADVTLDERSVALTVSRVYPQVKEGRFTIDLAFDTPPRGLLGGQALQGKLHLGDDRPALVLDAGAFLEETGGDWIFVLGPEPDSASRRRIRIGRRSSEQVEVLAGLKAGERVVVSDYRGLERIDRIELKH